MNQKCSTCLSCGMPLEESQYKRQGNDGNIYCIYCVHDNGDLKSFDEIFQGTVYHLKESQDLAQPAAEKMAYELLLNMPVWQHLQQKEKKHD